MKRFINNLLDRPSDGFVAGFMVLFIYASAMAGLVAVMMLLSRFVR